MNELNRLNTNTLLESTTMVLLSKKTWSKCLWTSDLDKINKKSLSTKLLTLKRLCKVRYWSLFLGIKLRFPRIRATPAWGLEHDTLWNSFTQLHSNMSRCRLWYNENTFLIWVGFRKLNNCLRYDLVQLRWANPGDVTKLQKERGWMLQPHTKTFSKHSQYYVCFRFHVTERPCYTRSWFETCTMPYQCRYILYTGGLPGRLQVNVTLPPTPTFQCTPRAKSLRWYLPQRATKHMKQIKYVIRWHMHAGIMLSIAQTRSLIFSE